MTCVLSALPKTSLVAADFLCHIRAGFSLFKGVPVRRMFESYWNAPALPALCLDDHDECANRNSIAYYLKAAKA
jgi:hypothetical protein